jgi:DNA-binding transcriptional LysR family regulator
MSQPPLNALRAFEAAARLGSHGAAAQELCVTQSAISHQIRHLEDWLNAPLYERGRGRVRLLPRGEALARDLTLALGGLTAACLRARARPEPEGLTIAAIPSVAICWLIPRLSLFTQTHPEIRVQVVYAMPDQPLDPQSAQIAFTFASAPPPIEGMTAQEFLPGASVPVCSPSLASSLEGAADLSRARLLHDSDERGWTEWLSRAGQPPPGRLEGVVYQDFNLLRAAALAGQGVALCPLAMIRPDLERGLLVQMSDLRLREEFSYYLLSAAPVGSGDASGAASGEAAAIFRDWALEQRDAA